MFLERLGSYADIFSGIGAILSLIIALKVALEVFKFSYAHFLAQYLGLGAKLHKSGRWAVVTGCTDGIGKAYAEQLAARGLSIVLLSRNLSKLEELAKNLESTYQVKTLVIVADFTRTDIYDNIKEKIDNLDIGILVNNVGGTYSYPEHFNEVDTPNFIENMLHLNCMAVSKMTHIVLRGMLKRDRGYIINLGSSAGTRPLPFLSLYSATKAFVETFTLALSQEYKGKCIRFQVVSPYFVTSKLSKMRQESLCVPSPSTFVRGALDTVGAQTATNGYWPHSLQEWYERLSPCSNILQSMKDLRARALKKKMLAAKPK